MHPSTKDYFDTFRQDADRLGFDTTHMNTPKNHKGLQRLVFETFKQARQPENLERLLQTRKIGNDVIKRIVRCAEVGASNGISEYNCCAAAEPYLLESVSTLGNFAHAQPIIVTDGKNKKPVGVIKRLGDTTMYGLRDATNSQLGDIQPRVLYDVGNIATNINSHPNAVPAISLSSLPRMDVLRPSTFIFPQSVRGDLAPHPLKLDPELDTSPTLHVRHNEIVKRVTRDYIHNKHFRPYI